MLKRILSYFLTTGMLLIGVNACGPAVRPDLVQYACLESVQDLDKFVSVVEGISAERSLEFLHGRLLGSVKIDENNMASLSEPNNSMGITIRQGFRRVLLVMTNTGRPDNIVALNGFYIRENSEALIDAVLSDISKSGFTLLEKEEDCEADTGINTY